MPRLVYADSGQTAKNLIAQPQMLSAAVLSYVVNAMGDGVMAWALRIAATINSAIAMLGSLLQLVYAGAWLAALSCLGLIYRLVAVPYYSRHTSAAVFSSQIAGSSELISPNGVSRNPLGLHHVVTGWLIARSSYLPRRLGWLLSVDGWAWVLDSMSIYLIPDANLQSLKAIFAAELIFMVWPLGSGWGVPEPQFLTGERR